MSSTVQLISCKYVLLIASWEKKMVDQCHLLTGILYLNLYSLLLPALSREDTSPRDSLNILITNKY